MIYPKLTRNHYIHDDTHCSDAGYLEVLNQTLSKIGVELPVYSPVEKENIKPGDLGRMLELPPIKRNVIVGFDVDSNIKSFSNFKALPGNSGEMHYKINKNAPIKNRVLLFGDSFFVGCMKLLAHFFEEVIYIRRPYLMESVVNVLLPSIVLTGNAERYLVNVKNKNEDIPFFVHLMNSGFEYSKMDSESMKAFNSLFLGKHSKEYKEWFFLLT
ncbi:hypothetical protein L4C54_17740 [Vibrio lamellibrachiae]|uniref:hypothetical protein n=1 Tax=Vibrio lamellibrachiae TaxID=2910253 RepID=UPI003D0C07CF